MNQIPPSMEAPDLRILLASARVPCLVLLPDNPKFTIIAVNDDFVSQVKINREDLLSKGVFEAFPHNPNDPTATGVFNLRASLNKVIKGRVIDFMSVQKYDISRPESEGGGFEERYWSPINSPIFDSHGVLTYILHHVEDVTEFEKLKRNSVLQDSAPLIKYAAQEAVLLVKNASQEAALLVKNAAQEAVLLVKGAALEAILVKNAAEEILLAKKAAEEAILAKKAAEDLAERKIKFLDIAAHELRTPITALSLLLELVEAQIEKGQPINVDTIARLRAPTDRLARLVVDLLDISRLERVLVVLLPVKTDMALLISGCLEEFRVQAPKRNFIFKKPNQPILINVDLVRINQVLANLLDNAVKYTSEGEIEIMLEEMPKVIRVSVTDHGDGIPKEQQALLFTAFSRGSSDATIRTTGLGLGLSVCQGIMDLHSGTIGHVSKEGQGSTFYFELPKLNTEV
ncbi:MAG: ATP-binding protein [Bacteriovorax sp.]|nr:ATP-binding protein [Bacteriovorax sp.]